MNSNERKDQLKKRIAPLDEFLGFSNLPFKISVRMMLKIAKIAITQPSYQRTEEIIKETLNVDVNDDTIRKVVNILGKIVYENDNKILKENLHNNTPKININKQNPGVLYLMTDGCFVRTVEPEENPNQIGNKCRWIEVKTALCFTSDDIKSYISKNGKMVHKIARREYISYILPSNIFNIHITYLGLRNGLGLYQTTILLSDGASWIKTFHKNHIPFAVHIVDFYHLMENAAKFANFIYKGDKNKIEETIKRWKKLFLNSQYQAVLEEIKDYKDVKCPLDVVNLYSYIVNNSECMDYKYYLEQGWFIGSGSIESANKFLVQGRVKLAGMKWIKENIQSVISLRSKLLSNLWEKDVVSVVQKYFKK